MTKADLEYHTRMLIQQIEEMRDMYAVSALRKISEGLIFKTVKQAVTKDVGGRA